MGMSEARTTPTARGKRAGVSREDEAELFRRVEEGCQQALEDLVQANLGMIVRVARQYRDMGVPFEDLLSEGTVGLIQAARRYDAGRGVKFVTYAVWWIRRGILQALNQNATIVRVSYHQKKKFREIRDTERALEGQLARKPDREELRARLQKTIGDPERVLRFGYREISLDDQAGDPIGPSLRDTLPGVGATAEDRLLREELDGLLTAALDDLPAKERDVIRGRFGLSGENALTLKELGERMRVSRERVRQIECMARDRLRRSIYRRLSGNPPHAATS